MAEESSVMAVAIVELGDELRSLRLCPPEVQEQMQSSLSKLGQLTPLQVYRSGEGLEVFDGLKRLRAARELSWPSLRAEVHLLEAVGAKVRMLRCNAGVPLSGLEEAWLVRSLYRVDGLSQPQIAVLLGRDKSWVCRRLALAEELSDELTANVRLGLVPTRSAQELARLPRGNQDAVAEIIVKRGLTTRQTASLVDSLLGVPPNEWPQRLEQFPKSVPLPEMKGGACRRTPGEQLVADAWAMKRMATRLHVRLLERSLRSLGEPSCHAVTRELFELRTMLGALRVTLDTQLGEGTHVTS